MKRGLGILSLLLAAMWLMLPYPALGGEDWLDKGLSFLWSGRYEEAIDAFSKAIESNPENAEAYNNRGAAWHHKGDYDRAIADYTKALEINPYYADAYNNRGVGWYHKGDYDKAIADYTKALDTNPRYAEAYKNLGDALFQKGEYARAIEACQKALEINPRYGEAYNQLAWIWAICPDETYRSGDKALEMAQKAVELSPQPDFLDTLAAAYAEAGKFGDAVTTQERGISMLKRQGRTEELAEYIERLDSYKARRPWRLKQGVEHHPYPYVVQVSSLRNREGSHLMAMKLKEAGEAAFTSRVLIPGTGEWYPVLIGFYGSLKEAQTAVMDFKRSRFPNAFVARMPYAIQIAVLGEDQKLHEVENGLQKSGYISYRIRDTKEGGKMRLLVGAFKTEKEAQKVCETLKEKGFEPRVVLR